MTLILKKDSSLFSASFRHNTIQENTHLELVPISLNLPTRCASCTFEPRVSGSCSGLLCLSFPSGCILWNPSTRTHHVIPNVPAASNEIKIDGLGYDERNDDYKLVRFVQMNRWMAHFWVYSLNSGSWDLFFRPNRCVTSGGFTDVFVNGCLHFKMKTKRGRYRIVAFDVSVNKTRVIKRPDCLYKNSIFDLGVFDGCLCLVRTENRKAGRSFQLFKMEHYGNGESWVKLFRFEMRGGPLRMRPIAYECNQNKKTLLFEGGGELFCVDTESHQQVPIMGMDSNGFTAACLCTESQRILDIPDDTERGNVI